MSRWARAAGGLADTWHAVALSSGIRRRPVPATLFGVPIVLWRSSSGLSAWIDACPHRGARLSDGQVDQDTLVCPYHGYTFGPDGRCRAAPVTADLPSVRAVTLPCREQEGFAWVSLGQPGADPPALGLVAGGWRFRTLTRTFDAPFDVMIENFVDSAHTPLVHRGLIRGGSRVEREVTVERDESGSVRVTHAPVAEHVGWLRSWVGAAETSHTDHYLPPATIRVDYDLGRGRAFAALLHCTPTTDDTCTLFARLGLRVGWLTGPAMLALPWLARRVLDQDHFVTKSVAETRRATGWEPGYPESDLMHRCIAEVLAAARAGEALPPALSRRIRLRL